MARWNDEDRSPLAKLRVKAGYTQAEASVKMNLGMISLARYENGVNDMTFGIGEQMAKLYHVSFEDIRQAVIATKEAAGIQTVGRARKTLTTKKIKTHEESMDYEFQTNMQKF